MRFHFSNQSPKKLQHKAFVIGGLCFFTLLLLLILTARLILLADFRELEMRLAKENSQRVALALDQDAKNLEQTLGDWCAWDDSLHYIHKQHPDFIEDNLNLETFTNLDLYLILLADNQHRVQWAQVVADTASTLIPPPPQMLAALRSLAPLWQFDSPQHRRVGLVQTEVGPLLLAAGPIVNSDNAGPIGGTMIMARRVNQQYLAQLAKRVQLQLSMQSMEPKQLRPGPPIALERISHQPFQLRPIDSSQLQGLIVFNDISHNPILTLTVHLPRRILTQGHRTIHYFLFWFSGSGILVICLAVFFLRRGVLKPMAAFTRQVTTLAQQADFSQRLQSDRHDELGRLSQAVNTMLTALDQGNQQLALAYHQLQETQAQLIQSAKLASIGQLAAGVAHELNQPLMVLRTTAQLLERKTRHHSISAETLQQSIELLLRNTGRMMKIITHLRTFSRQSGNDHREKVQINKVLQDCFLLLGEQLKLRNIEVVCTFAELPPVWADPNQLEQVFLNLIANARDAIVEAEEQGQLTTGGGRLYLITALGTSPETPTIEIRIEDNGIGITEGQHEKIFDPFYTTKEVGKGTGLGLAISYGIIQDHGGRLALLSSPPPGAVFSISLPVNQTLPNKQ